MVASMTAVVHSPENKCPLVDRSGVSADQSPKGALRTRVSVCNRTGLRPAEMEIEKWRPETGARNPPLKDRNSKNRRSETRARRPNPLECRGFSHTGK